MSVHKLLVACTFIVVAALAFAVAVQAGERPQKVFVVNTGEGSVSLVDLEAMKEIERYKVGPRPYGIAVSQDGKRVAVGVEDEECVKFYSLPDFKLEGKTPIGKMFNDHIVLTRVGKHIVVANFYSDDVVGINMETMKEEWRIKDLSAPHVVRYGPLGKHMFVTCKKASGVAIIDPETRKLVKFYPLTVNPRSLTFSPDESKVYCGSHWVNGFFEADFKTGKVSRLIELAPPKDNTQPQEVTYHGVQAIHDNIVLAANEGRSFLDAVDMKTGKLLDRLMEVSKPCCIEPIPGTSRVMLSNLGDGSLQFVDVTREGRLKSLGKAMVGKAPKRVAFVPTGSVLKSGALQSGPQPGNKVSVYNCLFINGTHAGKSTCFIEMAGANPVVMVYARSISDSLVRLVKRLDVELATRQMDRLSAQVVFLSDEEMLEGQLRQFVKQHSVKNVLLALIDSKGPRAWKLAKEADLTVILYKNYTVEANHAFRPGELTDRNFYRILADLPLIVEEPKVSKSAKEDQKPASLIEKEPADKSLERIEEQITDIQMQIEALRETRELLRKQSQQIKTELRNARFPGIRDPDLGYIYSLTLSPDGKLLPLGTDGKGVYLWNTTTRKRLRHLGNDIPAGISTVAFSPDGKTLAAACYYGGVSVWDVATGKHIRTLGDKSTAGRALAFSADGKTLASGDHNGGQIRLWEVASGKQLHAWHGHNHHITTVAFNPDGQSLGSYSVDCVLRLWDSKDGKLLREWKAAGEIGGLVFSPEGQAIAIGRREGTDTLSSWHPTDKKAATWFPGQLMNLMGTNYSTRDGQTFYYSARPNEFCIWEVRTRQERCRLVGHLSPVHHISGSTDGRLVVSACQNREILFWDVPGHLKRMHPVPKSVEEMWASLGNSDASKAYLAHWLLVDSPKQSVPFLQRQLSRVEAPQAERVSELLRDLNNDRFAVREQAVKELESLGELVEGSLRKAQEEHTSLEVRRRVDGILTKINANSLPGKLRNLRAIEVLEHIGTAEACHLLSELARGTPLAWETQEAQMALRRLSR